MSCKSWFSIVVISLLLVCILLSFPREFVVPKQARSRWTGYLAWHPEIIDFDQQKGDSFTLLSITLMGVFGYLCIKWTYNDNLSTKHVSYFYKNGVSIPTTLFNQLISMYIFMTFIAAIAYFILDVGKIWSVWGLLHNMLEIAILLVLHNNGKIKNNWFFVWMGLYVIVTAVFNIWLDWPNDGIYFKIQGLCTDWAVWLQFTRVYLTTRKYLGSEPSAQIPFALPPAVNNPNDEFYPQIVEHPHQLLLLVLGSFIHVIGNIANSVWIDSAAA
ncbi:2109_t:CDS:2 [Paraglomus occultum]|uniref:2109_t:CDS:1 n=1 Tax=Paraglomus occultum TaxID=144539 RepID=A0A9N9A649_9GLOM|nr:2109_t:CDS:2 [Paraglomus occultum]